MSILLLGTAASSYAQDQKQVDSLSYALYMQGRWDELIKVGDEAIDQGIDFYFLRLRVAWAHFTQEHYRQSIPHSEKAQEMNPESFPAKEYLYYSLLYSGLTQRAQLFASKQGETVQKKIGYEPEKILQSTYLVGGYSANPDYDYLESKASQEKEFRACSQKGFNFTSVGALMYSKDRRWAITPQLSYYRFNNVYSFVHPSPADNAISDKFDTYTNQVQAYLSVNRYREKNWHITLAGHYVYDSYNMYTPPSFGTTDYTESTHRMNSYVGHGTLAYDFSNFTADAYLQTSRINEADQNQFGAGLLWLPFGNYKLWLKASLNYQVESKTGVGDSAAMEQTTTKNYMLGLLNVGSRFGHFAIMLKSGYADSPFTNFTYNKASVVMNSIDRTRYFAGLDLSYRFGGKLGLTLGYTYYDQVSKYDSFEVPAGTYESHTYPYRSYLVDFGLVYQL